MEYTVTRIEEKGGKLFFNLEIIDNLGMYNFARWMSQEEKDLYTQENSNIHIIASKYLPVARKNKEREIEASRSAMEEYIKNKNNEL